MFESLKNNSIETAEYGEEMVKKVSNCFVIQGEMEDHIRRALLSPSSAGTEDPNSEKVIESLALATEDEAGIAKCAHLYRQLNYNSMAAFACIRKIAEILTNNPHSIDSGNKF